MNNLFFESINYFTYEEKIISYILNINNYIYILKLFFNIFNSFIKKLQIQKIYFAEYIIY